MLLGTRFLIQLGLLSQSSSFRFIVELHHEGIFRKTGNISRQKELKEKLERSESFDHTLYTIHDYASVLKSILSDLPEPLLHDKFIKAHLYTLGQ